MITFSKIANSDKILCLNYQKLGKTSEPSMQSKISDWLCVCADDVY